MNANTVGIVATSSLPWLTGTSIMPLFHAVYLNKRGFETTLYVPWLPQRHQQRCFPHEGFQKREEQQAHIVRWLPDELREFCPHIRFYPCWYNRVIKTTTPFRNISPFVGSHDVILLEEPDHLFMFNPWSRFKRRHPCVIGIVLTNYEYYHGQYITPFLASQLQRYGRFVMQRMCHKIIAISAAQAEICALPRCQVIPLNAVSPKFFQAPRRPQSKLCYFMGALIPEKGLEELFKGLQAAGVNSIDLFGHGNQTWVRQLAGQYAVHPVFKGVTNTPWEAIADYKIFINCSRCEYFCTTTANALVMKQWVILPKHGSNQFFYQFRNCLPYSTLDEFLKQFEYARTHEPEDDPKIAELSWDAAIDRLIDVIRS